MFKIFLYRQYLFDTGTNSFFVMKLSFIPNVYSKKIIVFFYTSANCFFKKTRKLLKFYQLLWLTILCTGRNTSFYYFTHFMGCFR